jgi:hypothetical protein
MDADAYVAALEFPALEAGEVECEHLVSLQLPELETLTAGEQGPAGRPGQPGPAGGSAMQREAGETLSALRAVYELDGQVFYLDYRDSDHIELLLGITLNAGQLGEPLNVQRSGVLDDAGWSWVLGPVWLGAAGALTQAPPSDGYHLLLGAAVASTRLLINLQPPIKLE